MRRPDARRRLDHPDDRRRLRPPARARLGPQRRGVARRRRAGRRPLRRAHRRPLRRRVDVPPRQPTPPRSRSSPSSTGCAATAPCCSTCSGRRRTSPRSAPSRCRDGPRRRWPMLDDRRVTRSRRRRTVSRDRRADNDSGERARCDRARPAVADAHLLRALDGHGLERALPDQPGQGPDRPVDRLRPADPDRLRPRRPRWRGARSARSACPSPTSATCARCSTASRPGEMNTSMTINATAAWLLGALRRQRRGAGRRARAAAGHDAERHRQGVPVAAARTSSRPSRRRRLIVDMVAWCARARAQVEPDERLQLPPAGGRGDAGAGDRLRAGHRHRRARRRARLGPGRARAVPGGVRLDLVLRQRRHPVRRGDLQAPGLHRAVGPHRRRALRRHRPEAPRRFRYGVQVNSLGLTEAQPENNVQRIVLEMLGVTLSKRARARSVQLPAWNEALGLAPPVGPAVVAADATGAGVRDRPARVRRHLRRLARDRGEDRRAGRGGAGRAGRRARPGRRVRGHRRAEGPPGARRSPSAPGASSRASRSWSASTASPRPPPSPLGGDEAILRVDPAVEAEMIADVAGAGAPAATRRGRRGARRAAPGGRAGTRTSCRPPSPCAPRRRHDRRVGAARCARSSASSGPRPASRAAVGVSATADAARAVAERVGARCRAVRRGSSSPSRASTATRTAPSRSPWRPATPAWRSSTPGIRLTPEQIAAVGPRRGRRRRRPVDPVRQPPRARARGHRGCSAARASTRRSSSAGSSPRTTGRAARRRRRRRLHAQGLRDVADHGRHRGHRREATNGPIDPGGACLIPVSTRRWSSDD